MGVVIIDMAMSLDGFTRDDVGKSLYPINQLRGTENLRALTENAGAVLMDMEGYERANGDFTGYEYQTEILVLTDLEPAKAANGENDKLSFTFVTDGIVSAIKKARLKAKGYNIVIVGGSAIAQLAIESRVADEIILRVMPVILGNGTPLFNEMQKKINLRLNNAESVQGRVDFYYNINYEHIAGIF